MSVSRGKNKKIKNASPNVKDGINFRSKLELYCYEKLKEADIDFVYEGRTFTIMQPFVFGGREFSRGRIRGSQKKGLVEKKGHVFGMTYTPDFVGSYKDGGRFIIETKGWPNDAFPLRWKVFKRYLYEFGFTWDLFIPSNKSEVDEAIKIIVNRNNS